MEPLKAKPGTPKALAGKEDHWFAARKGKANWAEFDRIMKRERGELPRPGDELPD